MKKIIWLLVCALLVAGLAGNAYADEKDAIVEEGKILIGIKDEFNELFEFNYLDPIDINGKDNNLLVEFDSKIESVFVIKEKCENLINIIQNEYSLEDFSESTWKEYRVCLQKIVDIEDSSVQESDYEYRFLRGFFDIYENFEKNEYVKEAVKLGLGNSINIEGMNISTDFLLATYLPYEDPYVVEYWEEYNDSDEAISLAASTFNLTNARNYAVTYATNPNWSSSDPAKYDYFITGDCTNFASQILYAAGTAQDVYSSAYSGWWHTTRWTSGSNPFLTHQHSYSWIQANTFVRYMGVVLSRTNHRSFSANIYDGNFIAFDEESDGDWDHVGFVVYADDYEGSYGYFDYMVAQHTRNYCAWTSTSTNNWEYIGVDGGTYARVRH